MRTLRAVAVAVLPRSKLGLPLAAALLLLAAPVAAQGTDDPTDSQDDEGEMSLDEISRMLDNPLGNLWMIFTENQSQRFRGDPSDGSQWVNTLLFQPIMPIPLTDNWNLIVRPILPFITAPKFEIDADLFGDCPSNCNSDPPGVPSIEIGSSRHNAWGDLMGWAMISAAEPTKLGDGSKLIWGVGPAGASRPPQTTSSAPSATPSDRRPS
jgi:hypothetical protein